MHRNASDSNEGAIHVYHWNNEAWEPLGERLFGDQTTTDTDNLGLSVSLSLDGTIVAGSAIWNPDRGTGRISGYMRVYDWQSGAWTPFGDDILGEAALDGEPRTSEAQADIAVKALNAHIDYTGEKLMAEKQAVIPVSTKDLTPPSPIISPAKSPVTVMTCIPCIPAHENVWEVIADYDDDKSVDEDDEADSDEEMTSTYSAKDFCLEKCNMPYLVAHANIRTPDRGVWNDELRVTAMIENIAF